MERHGSLYVHVHIHYISIFISILYIYRHLCPSVFSLLHNRMVMILEYVLEYGRRVMKQLQERSSCNGESLQWAYT